MENESKLGMGWVPSLPDIRDYTVETEELAPRHKAAGQKDSVKDMLEKINLAKPMKGKCPNKIDLRQWDTPIENQLGLGSCTAHAGVGVVQYCENRAFNRYIVASRLFLYKVERDLLHWTGDTGAYLRTAMGSLALFGVPPEEYWPYTDKSPAFDQEPPAFCYAFAENYKAIQYVRLDPPNMPKDKLLDHIKTFLCGGLPSMFGFTVYSSYNQTLTNGGKFPFPCPNERAVGGHAIVAMGYDDNMKIKNTLCGSETTGALLIRNSWGTGWGDKGYGWIPYDYVLKGLAVDWWALLKNEWIDTGKFGI